MSNVPVDELSVNPYKGKALKGKWLGLRRIRIGRYRVIYSVLNKELLVLILRVGHRKGVYR